MGPGSPVCAEARLQGCPGTTVTSSLIPPRQGRGLFAPVTRGNWATTENKAQLWLGVEAESTSPHCALPQT